MDKRERQDVVEAKELADKISSFVNTFSGGKRVDALVDEMFNDHRTLIQQKMGFVFKMIEKAAEMYDAGDYDLRNEHSLEKANMIMDAFASLGDGVPLI